MKSKAVREKMDPNSTEVEADNVIQRYSKRPKCLEHWCLADYVAQLEIVYPKADSSRIDLIVNEDDPQSSDSDGLERLSDLQEAKVNITLKNGIIIKQRRQSKVIRYGMLSIPKRLILKITSERECCSLCHGGTNSKI